jgi:hypothetical protein
VYWGDNGKELERQGRFGDTEQNMSIKVYAVCANSVYLNSFRYDSFGSAGPGTRRFIADKVARRSLMPHSLLPILHYNSPVFGPALDPECLPPLDHRQEDERASQSNKGGRDEAILVPEILYPRCNPNQTRYMRVSDGTNRRCSDKLMTKEAYPYPIANDMVFRTRITVAIASPLNSR